METFITCMNRVKKLFEESGFNDRMNKLRENQNFVEVFKDTIENAEKKAARTKKHSIGCMQSSINSILDSEPSLES